MVARGVKTAGTWAAVMGLALVVHLVAGGALWAVLRWLAPHEPAPTVARTEPPDPALIPYDIDLQNGATPNTTALPSPVSALAAKPESLAPLTKVVASPMMPKAVVLPSQVAAADDAEPVREPVPTTPVQGGLAPAIPAAPSSLQSGSSTGTGTNPASSVVGTGPGPGGAGKPGGVGVVGAGVDRAQLVARALSRIRAQRHYPELARRRGIEGTVRIAFVVGTDGTPRQIVVRRAADPLLDEAARDAVERAAPLPPLGPAEVDLDFRLDDN